MNWIHVITIIGVLGSIIIWMVNKLDTDVKSACTRLDGHAQRIDQLYVMFCKLQEDTNKKFYDLLKEKK